MATNVKVDEPPKDQAASTDRVPNNSSSGTWGYAEIGAVLCLLFLLFLVASTIVLSLIPVYLTRRGVTGTGFNRNLITLDVTYGTNVINGSSLTVTNLNTLSSDISRQLRLRGVIVNSAVFFPRSTGTRKKRQAIILTSIQCRSNLNTPGDWLALSITIPNRPGCITTRCRNVLIARARRNIDTLFSNINVNMQFTNGQVRNVQLVFCSYGRPVTASIPQLTQSTTSQSTTSQSPIATTQPTFVPPFQPILTRCQPNANTGAAAAGARIARATDGEKKPKLQPFSSTDDDHVLMQNTYMVEFALDACPDDPFKMIAKSVKATHGIDESAMQKRYSLRTPLFCGASFTLNAEKSIDALEMMEEIDTIHPVYTVPALRPLQAGNPGSNTINFINSHNLTGVNRVQNGLGVFGRNVRVAVIDSGTYYVHPALGGCFGPGCQVAFGFDFIGGGTVAAPIPDNDPFDNCDAGSHGTFVSGMIAANTSTINQPPFIPDVLFTGVAPQVTLGAYAVNMAIMRAQNDGADIIRKDVSNSSRTGTGARQTPIGDIDKFVSGGRAGYPDATQANLIQRVSDAGVYVIVSVGNSGGAGLQTAGDPGIAPAALAIGSVDTQIRLVLPSIIAPNGDRIPYQPGVGFGRWRSVVNSPIVVNDPNRAVSDGCNGPARPVRGAVVLFSVTNQDQCTPTVRCDLAAAQGATGCLLYGVVNNPGATNIPSGSISQQDGLNIVAIVAANPFAIYAFTDALTPTVFATGGTPSDFSSFGLTGDLQIKPQISGVGGQVYSTISDFAATQAGRPRLYTTEDGTSFSAPYVAGVLALLLASIGNPSPATVNGNSPNGICRPRSSVVANLIQSTAVPVRTRNPPLLASVAQQGAGLVNAFQMLTATAIFSPSELALNDTVRLAPSYTVTLRNIGPTTGVYTISHNPAALATGRVAGDDQLLNTPTYSADYAAVNIVPTTFQLESGQSRQITLQFTPPTVPNPALLPVYSGFISATNTLNGQVAQLSYAGVVGNYGNTRILVRNSAGFVTGLFNLDGTNPFVAPAPTLSAAQGVLVQIVLAWATRIVFAEVVSGQETSLTNLGTSLGVVYSEDSDATLFFTDQARNVATPDGQGYTQFTRVTWNGAVCPLPLGTRCPPAQANPLAPGSYRIRFAALQHFGDRTNPAGYDVFLTPPFTLGA